MRQRNGKDKGQQKGKGKNPMSGCYMCGEPGHWQETAEQSRRVWNSTRTDTRRDRSMVWPTKRIWSILYILGKQCHNRLCQQSKLHATIARITTTDRAASTECTREQYTNNTSHLSSDTTRHEHDNSIHQWSSQQHRCRNHDWQWSSNTWTGAEFKNCNRRRDQHLWIQTGTDDQQQQLQDNCTLLRVWRETTHHVSNTTDRTRVWHTVQRHTNNVTQQRFPFQLGKKSWTLLLASETGQHTKQHEAWIDICKTKTFETAAITPVTVTPPGIKVLRNRNNTWTFNNQGFLVRTQDNIQSTICIKQQVSHTNR